MTRDAAARIGQCMARALHRETIELGGLPAIRIGGPSPTADLYYWVMAMSWPAFVALAAALYLAINLAFGAVYAAMPGAIAHAAPYSIADGFFFSVDTLGTVGYGDMAPATRAAHAVAAIEILVGMFFSATMTGLIFARFARPRQSLEFSRVAVIGRHGGQRALIVRVGSRRSKPIADAQAQMSLLETQHQPDGSQFRSLVPLPLVRNVNPMLGLSWTLVHLIDEDGPVLRTHAGSDRFLLTVTVGGVDTLLASPSQGAMRYEREQVLLDREFVDVIADDGGVVQFDMTKLHDTVPVDPHSDKRFQD